MMSSSNIENDKKIRERIDELERYLQDQHEILENLHNASVLKKRQYYKAIAEHIAEIKELCDPKEKSEIHKNPWKYAFYIFTTVLLVLAGIVNLIDGFGVTYTLFGIVAFPLPFKALIVLGIIFGLGYLFTFIGFDFSKITNKLGVTYFVSGQVLDIHIAILRDIEGIAYSITQEKCRITTKSFNTLKTVFNHSKGFVDDLKNTPKPWPQRIAEWVACIFIGILLVSGALLGTKGGVLAFMAILGLSGNVGVALLVVALIAAVGLRGTVYAFQQGEGIRKLCGRLFGIDPVKLEEACELVRHLCKAFQLNLEDEPPLPRLVQASSSFTGMPRSLSVENLGTSPSNKL